LRLLLRRCAHREHKNGGEASGETLQANRSVHFSSPRIKSPIAASEIREQPDFAASRAVLSLRFLFTK
jgi:hypothetical protein